MSFAEYVKFLRNLDFHPKSKAVAEIFSAEKHPLTYLGKVKKNQISQQGNFVHGSHCLGNRVKKNFSCCFLF